MAAGDVTSSFCEAKASNRPLNCLAKLELQARIYTLAAGRPPPSWSNLVTSHASPRRRKACFCRGFRLRSRLFRSPKAAQYGSILGASEEVGHQLPRWHGGCGGRHLLEDPELPLTPLIHVQDRGHLDHLYIDMIFLSLIKEDYAYIYLLVYHVCNLCIYNMYVYNCVHMHMRIHIIYTSI